MVPASGRLPPHGTNRTGSALLAKTVSIVTPGISSNTR